MTEIGPDCFFYSDNVIIRCNSGSYAERYAKENNLKYVIMAQKMGDADGDGEITFSDVTDAFEIVLNTGNPLPVDMKEEYMIYMDMDDDGYVTANDAALINEKAKRKTE